METSEKFPIQTQLWTQKNGVQIRICDMDDYHLKNCILMLERKAAFVYQAELKACLSLNFQGEIAQMEQDNFLGNSSWEDFLPPIYQNMLNEQTRRIINDIKIPKSNGTKTL